MPSVAMVFDIIARDGASPTFQRLGREADGASRSFNNLTKAAAGITAIVGAFAVKEAVQFESAMTRISTQAGVPQRNLKQLSDALLQLSPKVGFNPDELATSLYHVESAFRTTGISAQKAGDTVAAAAKLAKIGHADLETTTQAIVGVLASGIKGVKDANDAAAQLNLVVGAGDTTLQKVADSIATGILPTAQSLGLSFKDVGAALATLTDNVTPADEAATRLRTTLSLVEKPSKQATAALESIHLPTDALAEDFRKPNGLLVALEDLKTHLNNTYPLTRSAKLSTDEIAASTKQYTTELLQQGVSQKEAISLGKKYEDSLKRGGSAATEQAKVILSAFGGARSGSTFLTLYNEIDRLQSKYKDFGTAAQAAAKFQDAWTQQQQTAKQKLDDLKASWDVFLVKMGNAILPVLKDITDTLSKHPGILQAAAVAVGLLTVRFIALKTLALIEFFGTLATRILALGTASGVAAGEAGLGRLAGGAAAARGILATEAGGGLAGAAGKASTGVAGLGAAFSTAAGLAGGFALALGGIALGIKSIIDDNKSFKLPSIPDLGHAIQTGGLTGQPGSKLIDQALSSTGTGNNKNENFQQYFNRVLGSSEAKNPLGFDKSQTAAIDATALSMAKLKNILQKGTRGDFDEFKASLLDVEHALNASPKTINTVTKFLDQLFDRYNSGREAAKKFADDMVKNEPKILGTSTSVAELSKQYGVNKQMAENLAAGNKDLQDRLINVNSVLATNGATLDGNSKAAQTNRAAIDLGVASVKEHAEAVYKQTGSLDASQQAFSSGIKTIEDNAAALGINRDVTNDLILKLLGVKNNSQLHITVNADGTFSLQDISFSGDQQSLQSGHHAAGGHIMGPGTGTSDSIPAWLSNGEFVVKAQQTAKFLPLLHAINDGKFQGFASGGLAAFDSAFGPTVNQHVDNLETRMAAEAKKWFDYRRSVDATASDGNAGPGQSFSLIIEYMRRSGIGFTQADPGLGRGGSSWHEAGDAVDFSGGDLEAMAAYWHKVAGSLLEEIHSPNYYVKNGKDVGPGFYGPSIVAQHYDHVHIAAGLAAMQGLIGAASSGSGHAGSLGGSVANAMAEAIANSMMAQHGWNGHQISEVDAIWTQESGFDPNAVNPDGGAYGIPQAYPPAHGHPYALGDIRAQVAWGINYIDSIGGPDAAYARKVSTGTYDQGGVVPPGIHQVINASGKPEALLTNAQWQQFGRFVTALEKANFVKYAQAINATVGKLTTQFATYITGEQQFRDTLKGNITSGNGFNDLIAHAGTAGDIKTLVTGKAKDIKAFVGKITALRKAGWPLGIIRDIANDGIGPGSQYADVLLKASKTDKASIIAASNDLSATSSNAAAWITSITGGAGLTVPSALSALNTAIFQPNVNVGYWTQQAAKAQAAAMFNQPLMHVENQHINSNVDLQQQLAKAQFLQSVSGSL